MRRIFIGSLLAVAFVAVGLSPAYAEVSKTGTQPCTLNQTGMTRSYSIGTTEHYPPGSGYAIFYNGSTWFVRTATAGSGGGGWWGVFVTGGSLSDPGTWATCITGTP